MSETLYARIFQAADINEDGEISPEELDQFISAIQTVNNRLRTANKFTKELSPNGTIKLEEWQDLMNNSENSKNNNTKSASFELNISNYRFSIKERVKTSKAMKYRGIGGGLSLINDTVANLEQKSLNIWI